MPSFLRVNHPTPTSHFRFYRNLQRSAAQQTITHLNSSIWQWLHDKEKKTFTLKCIWKVIFVDQVQTPNNPDIFSWVNWSWRLSHHTHKQSWCNQRGCDISLMITNCMTLNLTLHNNKSPGFNFEIFYSRSFFTAMLISYVREKSVNTWWMVFIIIFIFSN